MNGESYSSPSRPNTLVLDRPEDIDINPALLKLRYPSSDNIPEDVRKERDGNLLKINPWFTQNKDTGSWKFNIDRLVDNQNISRDQKIEIFKIYLEVHKYYKPIPDGGLIYTAREEEGYISYENFQKKQKYNYNNNIDEFISAILGSRKGISLIGNISSNKGATLANLLLETEMFIKRLNEEKHGKNQL